MITGQDIIKKALVMDGKPYIYGYEVDLDDPNPEAADCSEMVEWACHQCGVKPTMPDGAVYQYRHCRKYGTLIGVDKARDTPGALLFVIDYENEHYHVAVSQEDGKTIECRGHAYG